MNRFFIYIKYCFLFILFLICENKLFSLPASFLKNDSGNMRDVEWERIESSHFDIYYPKNSYQMGKYSLYSAENAYPYLSLLLGVRIKNDTSPILTSQTNRTIISSNEKITYILGSGFEGSGFANPVTLNIEAQMINSRSASFFQHELVHRLMYEHNDFNIGPLGRVFSLAMFPTWWIEGLAEYLTESIGKDQTDLVARNMALNNNWPSWERMHALYNADGDTNLRGYVASGRFLRWILSRNKEKDLYKIHKQISSLTVSFPFYNATDVWLRENLGNDGKYLYSVFQKEQKLFWENYLNKMPELVAEKTIEGNGEEYYYPALNFNNSVVFSKMYSELSAYNSSLHFMDFTTDVETRIPLSTPGSFIFATSSFENGTILTVNLKKFSNSIKGHELVALTFNGNISEISDKNIVNKKNISFSNSDIPLVVNQIQFAGEGKFFVLANLNGISKIFMVNVYDNSINLLSEYPFYSSIKLIPNLFSNNKLKCIDFIIDDNLENTSIEKLCENGYKSQLIAPKILNIKNAYVLKDGKLRILTSWGKVMAFVDYIPQKGIKPIAAFPDWLESIFPWTNDEYDRYVGAWVYKKGKYYLKKIDLHKANEEFSKWQREQSKNSIFLEFPIFVSSMPSFVEIYNQQKQFLLGNDVNQFENNLKNNSYFDSSQHNLNDESKSEAETPLEFSRLPATYRSLFLFAYPYAIPDFLGGPSIGLFAIPLTDEMERYRIQLFGGYNFFLKSPSGAVTYINNRFLDSFSVSLFSSPFFNGYYDLMKTTSEGAEKFRYYNYLQQKGISVSGSWIFSPFSSSLQGMVSLYQLSPYQSFQIPPQNVGAQKALMLSATSLFTSNIFNAGFYLAKNNVPHGNWMNWKTDFTLGGGKFNSLENSTDSLGQNSGSIDYFNLNSSILSNFSLYNQNISLLGKISTTQGNNTLNIKEIYSPYQSYILGNTTSLNYVSYPIFGTGSLFDLMSGYWNYSGTLNYDFPLYSAFEKKLLMIYVNDLRGNLSLTRGGVSVTKNLSNYSSISSASIGTSLTLDIKGFQVFPSLVYGWVLGQENNWYLLMQLKFMDIL